MARTQNGRVETGERPEVGTRRLDQEDEETIDEPESRKTLPLPTGSRNSTSGLSTATSPVQNVTLANSETRKSGVAASMHAAREEEDLNMEPRQNMMGEDDGSDYEEELPDPFEFARSCPQNNGDNHYKHLSDSKSDVIYPSSVLEPYTEAVYHRVVITHDKAMTGHSAVTVKALKANPSAYTQLTPHNAGYSFFKNKSKNTKDLIHQWFLGVAFDNETDDDLGWQIFEPDLPWNAPANFPHSAPPYTFLIKGLSSVRRKWMLNQQTFAISKSLCFHVTAPDPTRIGPWHLGNWEVDSIIAIPERKRLQIFAAMLETVWKHPRFWALTIKETGNHPDFQPYV